MQPRRTHSLYMENPYMQDNDGTRWQKALVDTRRGGRRVDPLRRVDVGVVRLERKGR